MLETLASSKVGKIWIQQKGEEMASSVAISYLFSKTYKTFGDKLSSSFIVLVKIRILLNSRVNAWLQESHCTKKSLSLKSVNEELSS